MLFVYILVAVLISLLMFFFWCYTKRTIYRVKLLSKIKARNLLKVKILNPFFFVSSNSNNKHDFCIETEENIVFVKLFSILRKSSAVVFNGTKEYKYKSFFYRYSQNHYGLDEYHCRKMKLENIGAEDKPVIKMILFCPMCRFNVSKYDNNESVKQIFPGDYIDDYIFSNGSYLLSLLDSKDKNNLVD